MYVNTFLNCFYFPGRARRKEFWIFYGVYVSLSVFFSISKIMHYPFGFYGNIFKLLAIMPLIAVSIRRMHDIGKSGWYTLIPIYNLILWARDGESKTNEYGDDPKGRSVSILNIDDFGKKEKDINTEI